MADEVSATPSVVVTATDASGVGHTIQLEAIGPTAATIVLNQTMYVLSNVRRLHNTVLCETPVLFSTAVIGMAVTALSVKISITGVWFAPPPQAYAISAKDSAALLTWLNNFPEDSTMVFPYKFGSAPPASFPYKFGRRKMVAPKVCMNFRGYQLLSFPTPPSAGSYRPKAAPALARMYKNDALGDCVIAWMAHAIGTFTGNAEGSPVIFTDSQIVAMYEAIGGYDPRDPSSDQGCDENQALDYWVTNGFVTPEHKISGFLSIDPTNKQEIMAAVWLFENLMFGVPLPDAWTHPAPNGPGFVWDVAGEPNPDQGHCFGAVSWDDVGVGVETWGMDGTITYAAIAKYASVYAGGQLFTVITPEILNRATGKAPNGFDFNQLRADFVGMGGKVWPSANPKLIEAGSV